VVGTAQGRHAQVGTAPSGEGGGGIPTAPRSVLTNGRAGGIVPHWNQPNNKFSTHLGHKLLTQAVLLTRVDN
jgi:hypothetical protein